jgi:hypothetical protein
LDKSSTSRRVNDAIAQGYIVNLEPLRGRPSRLVLGEPLPDDAPVLPARQVLAEAIDTANGESSDAHPPTSPA